MSDLQRYIETRKAKDPAFADGFDAGYTDFKIGIVLRQARETAGLTQEQVARRLGTKKSAISRIENHAENVTLATLKAYAQAVGRPLQLQLLLGSSTQ
jgi:DNA-binding XRE family transcriptional regulator